MYSDPAHLSLLTFGRECPGDAGAKFLSRYRVVSGPWGFGSLGPVT